MLLCGILFFIMVTPAGAISSLSVTASGATSETNKLTITLTFPDPVETAAVRIVGSDPKVYADPALTVPVTLTASKAALTLRQAHTFLYVDNSGTLYTVDIVSPRAAVTYKDAATFADWAKYYIQFLNYGGGGMMTGDGVSFRPADQLTRFETAVLAAKLLGIDPFLISFKNPYADKLAGWARPSVLALTRLGVLNGEKTDKGLYFRGERHITRSEVAKIFVGILLLLRENSTDAAALVKDQGYTLEGRSFADLADVAAWAKPCLTLAVCRYKIIEGSRRDGKLYLLPRAEITRAEIAVMVGKLTGYNAKDLLRGYIGTLSAVYDEESKKDTVMSKAFFEAYNAALASLNAGDAGSECKKRFDALYTAVEKRLGGLIYLSPSHQMDNRYAGYDTTEGAQMIAVGTLVYETLKAKGYDVYLTPKETSLVYRADEANAKGAICYVSIHSNAVTGTNNGSAQGTTVYYSNNPGSKSLAKAIYDPLAALTPTKDNGIINDSLTRLPYKEIRLPKMANVIAEVEYHDYAPYAKWIIEHRSDLAAAIVKGIETYMKSL